MFNLFNIIFNPKIGCKENAFFSRMQIFEAKMCLNLHKHDTNVQYIALFLPFSIHNWTPKDKKTAQ